MPLLWRKSAPNQRTSVRAQTTQAQNIARWVSSVQVVHIDKVVISSIGDLFVLGLYQDNIGVPCALPDNQTFVEDIKFKEWLGLSA